MTGRIALALWAWGLSSAVHGGLPGEAQVVQREVTEAVEEAGQRASVTPPGGESSSPASGPVGGSSRYAIRVRVYGRHAVGSGTLARTLEVANGLLTSAGLDVDWRACDLGASCPPDNGVDPEAVVILMSEDLPEGEGSCGTANRGRVAPRGTVLVSLHCVASVGLALTRLQESCANPYLMRPSSDDLVGAVIAHEIGHLFGLEHAKFGLMRGTMTVSGILALRRGALTFTMAEATHMRSVMLRFHVAQVASLRSRAR